MSNNTFIEKNISKEFSGSWNLDIKAIAAEYTAPSRNDIITEEGQNFRVTNVEKERSGEETYINVQARHIAFDLEDIYVIKGKVEVPADPPDNINIDPSFDGWQVEYQLKGTLQEHLIELFQFAPGFTVGTVPVTENRTVTVTSTNVFSNMKKILDRFNCGYILDNTEVSAEKYEDMIDGTSSVNLHYSVNNINMSREMPYEDVISKLYAEATIIPDDPAQDPENIVVEKGSGYPEYFVDFGELEEGETQTEKLDELAQAYYDIRSNPAPRYSFNIVELKNHPDYTGSYIFDTGDIVNVQDPELNINEDMVVVGYNYSLMDDTLDSYTSSVQLGRLEQERLPPDFEVFEREKNKPRYSSVDLKEVVELTRDYIIEQIFGGTAKDLNDFVVKLASRHTLSYPSGLGWKNDVFTGSGEFVGINNVMSGLNSYINDPGGALTYSGDFEVFNPVEFVKEEAQVFPSRFDFESLMNFWIDTYVSVTTDVASEINTAYQNVFGETGTSSSITIENQPEHIMKRIDGMLVFSFFWKNSVTNVINSAISKAGNPTEIYEEIGGGRNGYIPAVNRLYDEISDTKIVSVENEQETRKQINPNIFTSEEGPEDTKGTDGDIWLQFEVEEGGE